MAGLEHAPRDVQEMVAELQRGIVTTLGTHLVGLYLTGSLTYGGFDPGSSDVDYLAVLHQPLSANERSSLADLHAGIGARHPVWRERIEGSYVTTSMLPSVTPPPDPRSYVNQGAFWNPDPPYGSEWLINRYALQECGLPLVGPPFNDLVPPVDITAVRAASTADLLGEWLPQVDEPGFLPDSHHEAYVSLTMCRILHRQFNDEVVSKRGAAGWVRARVDPSWQSLIDDALNWQHGQVLDRRADVRAFVILTSYIVQNPAPLWTGGNGIGTAGPSDSASQP